VSHKVIIGLGSNLGDRKTNLRKGLVRLTEIGTIQKLSSIFAVMGDVGTLSLY